MDAADLAILETYADAMNPVEKGLVEEVRRLFDAVEASEGAADRIFELEEELESAKDDNVANQVTIEQLQARITELEELERDAAEQLRASRTALEDLRHSMRDLLGIPTWVEAEVKS